MEKRLVAIKQKDIKYNSNVTIPPLKISFDNDSEMLDITEKLFVDHLKSLGVPDRSKTTVWSKVSFEKNLEDGQFELREKISILNCNKKKEHIKIDNEVKCTDKMIKKSNKTQKRQKHKLNLASKTGKKIADKYLSKRRFEISKNFEVLEKKFFAFGYLIGARLEFHRGMYQVSREYWQNMIENRKKLQKNNIHLDR